MAPYIPIAFANRIHPMRNNNNNQEPPPKYIHKNGVMKLNPQYKRWKESQDRSQPATTVARPAQALAVVSSLEEHEQLNKEGDEDIPLAEATLATQEMLNEPEIIVAAGTPELMQGLGNILEKYEVPLGLTNKLLMLSEYQSLEFIIDDSGSMRNPSDTINALTKRPNTRWEEAQQRLLEMMELIAHVPTNQVAIEFLNRKDRIVLPRAGQTPTEFYQNATTQINQAFSTTPRGTTPALEKLTQSLRQHSGVKVARYFFGDGLPNGGRGAQRQIVALLASRAEPHNNPVTFISCTNEDAQVEWMKDAEEMVPYCSESDDFADEAREVLRDQGEAFPYTKGFYLICQLVAAANPHDLDAMDESVPFPKATLDNLLGVVSTGASYQHYFTCFVKAQKRRTVEGPLDQIKKRVQWNYDDFCNAKAARDIAAVRQFQEHIKAMVPLPQAVAVPMGGY